MAFQPVHPSILHCPQMTGAGIERPTRVHSKHTVQVRQCILELHGISWLPSVCDVRR